MSSNTCAISPDSLHLNLLQSGDSNGCEVVGSYITIHQGQSSLSHGCAAVVKGEGIGVAQDGDDNATRVFGAEHEVIQDGHSNQALVLGGLGNQVTQNGYGSKVEIVDGRYNFNRVTQQGPCSVADLRGSRNRISQDGGPSVWVKGNRNRVKQHGLDNQARIGRNGNVVKQSGNQNVLKVRGNENNVKSCGIGNEGRVFGDKNMVAIAGKSNLIATRGTGNRVAVKGKANKVVISGDNFNVQIDANGLKGHFSNGTFTPTASCKVRVSVTVVDLNGASLHMISAC